MGENYQPGKQGWFGVNSYTWGKSEKLRSIIQLNIIKFYNILVYLRQIFSNVRIRTTLHQGKCIAVFDGYRG